MNTFAAFGVGLGNLGRHSRVRIAQHEWIASLNGGLARLQVDAVVVSAYGHTGNFVLRSAGDRLTVASALGEVLNTGCAVIMLDDLRELVHHLGDVPASTAERGIRWTRGAALLVNGLSRTGDLQGTSGAEYSRFSESVVLVQKRDAITPSGILDRNRRAGGWGAIAGEVSRQLGGTWTARSVRTLTGTLKACDSPVPFS